MRTTYDNVTTLYSENSRYEGMLLGNKMASGRFSHSNGSHPEEIIKLEIEPRD